MKLDEKDLMELEIVTLELDDGTVQDYGIVDDFQFEGHSYILAAPIMGGELLEDAIIFEYTKVDGEMEVFYIDDDEMYDHIVIAYNNYLDEQN